MDLVGIYLLENSMIYFYICRTRIKYSLNSNNINNLGHLPDLGSSINHTQLQGGRKIHSENFGFVSISTV